MVSLDTMVLLWGIKKHATQGQKNMIKRAERYLDYLTEQGSRPLVCAPVVAEYLVRYDAEDRKDQLRVLNKNFIVAPLDARAAEIAAALLHDLGSARDDCEAAWQCIKTDAMILGCSIAVNASRMISDDPDMKRIAQGHIIVEPIPADIDKLKRGPSPKQDQPKLTGFDEADIEV